jgi:hypothetical protein
MSNEEVETRKVLQLGKPCPPLAMKPEQTCDVMHLTYRLSVVAGHRLVELALRYELERCTLGYTLGDLLYSTTLLPGERVWLSFRNRHSVSRLTEDTSFSASTHSRSSESVWMDTYRHLATDIDRSVSTSTRSSSHSEFETKASGGYATLGIIGTADVEVSGKFDSNSTLDFSSELHDHLESTFHQSNEISRMSESASVTEINSHRTVEKEVNDELKAGVRIFRNINACHTLTFLFYQIAKRQRVRIKLTGVSYRALNPDAETAVRPKDFVLSLADNQEILKVSDRIQLAEKHYATLKTPPAYMVAGGHSSATGPRVYRDAAIIGNLARLEMVIPIKDREAAVAQIKKELPQSRFEFEFERELLLPTNAVFVDSALGGCLACEPYVVEKQKLELERLRLENEKLKQETELLDKHQLYRCCPAGEKEEPGSP